MEKQGRSFGLHLKQAMIYLVAGLAVDSLLTAFFALFDILEVLNLSLESLFRASPAFILNVTWLYFMVFPLCGLLITILLLLLYFLYQKELALKTFIRVKVEILLISWVVILFPVFFHPRFTQFSGLQLQPNTKLILVFGVLFFIFSVLSLYSRSRAIKFPLYAMRFLLAVFLLPVICSIAYHHFTISGGRYPAEDQGIGPSGGQAAKDLNVLLITIDTLRADKLSCYHFEDQTSPNIDGLAESGFIFDLAFSSSNWTRPATASLFTSLYPVSHQANTLVQKIPESLRCLPERFKQAGYQTGVFSGNANVCPDFGFDQGVDYFFETKQKSRADLSALYMMLSVLSPSRTLKNKLRAFKKQSTISENVTEEEAIYDSFLKWLDGLKGKTFFAYLHFNTPHSAYDPPAKYDVFSDDPSIKVNRRELPANTSLSEEKLLRLLSLYYGEIHYVDDVIGNIIETLKQKKIQDKTIIAIAADHGEEFYDHQAWGHSHSMYNELLHIPLIFFIPDFPYPPARIQNKVSIIDVGPTLLSLAGLPADHSVDGKDLTPLLKGNEEDVHEFLFAERIKLRRDISKYAVIGKNYKYIQYNLGNKQIEAFFDLNHDFKEKNRLLPGATARFEELKEKLAAYKDKTKDSRVESVDVTLSEEKKEELRELGYIK